ncbi:MAG: hypothetical protein K2Q10_05235, partial [Rhodospirillales bacterium]|nr:hypothetical protein [Rhodospirillales bacterium]
MAKGSLLARWSVRTRIYAGFVMVLLLLALTALTGVLGLKETATDFEKYASVSSNAVRVVAIDRLITGLRRNVLLYTEKNDSKALERLAEIRKNLGSMLDEAIRATSDPERRGNLKRMAELQQAYGANIDQVVPLQQKQMELQNMVTERGIRLRKLVSDLVRVAMADNDMETAAQVGLVQEVLMLGRISAARYVADPTEKSATEGQTRLTEFAAMLETLSKGLKDEKRLVLAREAGELAPRLITEFKALVENRQKIDQLVTGVMAQEATEIAKLADSTSRSQQNALVALKDSSTNEIESGITNAVALSAGAFLLGLFLAWLIAGSIVKPVVAMTEAMTRLAGGDKGT